MSEVISTFALGLILLVIAVWVGFWVFVGYLVAGVIDEEPTTGMIYAATLGPLGIVLLLVGHFISSESGRLVSGANDIGFENTNKFTQSPSDDPLR